MYLLYRKEGNGIENKVEVKKEETDILAYETTDIKSLIYCIRGKQIILDNDVANLYQYKTKRINEVVNRNKERFPENFCFQLTQNEFEDLRSQFATSNNLKFRQGKSRW